MNESGGWYELFSRGARDWLRHNDKIREAVREHLPQIVAGGDVLSGGARSVRVPVRMLEHYHFRLRRPGESGGVGQGRAKPGDVLVGPAPQRPARGDGRGEGGEDDGGIQFSLEFQVDDIVDWLWEEMRLPNLQPRTGPAEESEWVREGIDRRGARSRLDRRRSLKESVKRRAHSGEPAGFLDEDLRYRQLARRRKPSVQAVVFFVLDVSGSMTDRDRKLAKSFFFWVVHGLRREYRLLETVFVAHTTEAWEFAEPEFFQVTGSGGTIASTGFEKVREIMQERYSTGRHNVYIFYASDGDNALSDRGQAQAKLGQITQDASFAGYVEVSSGFARNLMTETGRLFNDLVRAGRPASSFVVSDEQDVWSAVRHFFAREIERA